MCQILFYPESNTFSKRIVESTYLFQVMWHITHLCPNDCIFCLDKPNSGRSELSRTPLVIEQTVLLLKELGVQKIDLSGGEPLTCPHLIDIVEACRNHGIYITITTSGCGIEDNIEWLCSNWKYFSRVILSLDGLSNEHNHIRRNANAYEKFLNCYNRLFEAGCNRLRINSVVTPFIDSNTYRTQFAHLIEHLQPKEWCIIKPFNTGQRDDCDLFDISNESFDDFVSAISMEFDGLPTKVIVRSDEYSSYWILTADNTLIYGDAKQSFSAILNSANLDTIRNAIRSRRQLLPYSVA